MVSIPVSKRYLPDHSYVNNNNHHRLVIDITAKIIYDDSHDNYAPSEDIGMKSQFDDFNLRSLADQNSVDPDRTLNITIEEGITTDGLNRGMVNRIPFIKPLTPMLFSELTMGGLANDHRIYGPQSNAYITKHLEFVELVVNNYDEDAHPCMYYN